MFWRPIKSSGAAGVLWSPKKGQSYHEGHRRVMGGGRVGMTAFWVLQGTKESWGAMAPGQQGNRGGQLVAGVWGSTKVWGL